jgi:hypothetical protein
MSFPRGSRKITLRAETSTQFQIVAGVGQILFAGCRQYFTKPAYEKLTVSQAVLKTFDISPISLYATIYGHNGGTLYSPNAQDDNINTITEVGSWSGPAVTTAFNGATRTTSTINDYVEIDFTLVGNGGGIALKNTPFSSTSLLTSLYLSTSAINESTDLIHNTHYRWASTYYDQDTLGIIGLPAGTYKARFKNRHGSRFDNYGIVVIDTVAPQENANTVTDINNTGQGVAYPINVIREIIQQDSAERVPVWLERSGYKEGRVSKVNYALNSPIFNNREEGTGNIFNADSYFANYTEENVSGFRYNLSAFSKSISLLEGNFTTNSTTLQIFLDGVQTLNNHSQRIQVKGGSAPSATRVSHSNLTQKLFNLTSSFSAGDTFLVSDTRGFRNDLTIILDDGTNKEKAVIASFVVGTSFTVKKARAVVIDANVATVEFQGFHSYKIESNDAVAASVSAFEYEPLKVSPSKAMLRRSTDFEYEKVSVTHDFVANDDLYYPVHSDGVVGNWTTSTLEIIKGDGLAFDFPQDLKHVQGTGVVKITSERLVPVLKENERV